MEVSSLPNLLGGSQEKCLHGLILRPRAEVSWAAGWLLISETLGTMLLTESSSFISCRDVWSTLVFHSPNTKHLGHCGFHFVLVPGVWCPHLAISFLFPLLCFIEVKLHPVKMHTSYTYNWMSFDNSKVDTHVPTPKSRKRTFLSHRKPAYISLWPTSHPETILSLLSIYSLTVFHVVSLTPTGCSNFIFFILFPFWLCHKACGILVPWPGANSKLLAGKV